MPNTTQLFSLEVEVLARYSSAQIEIAERNKKMCHTNGTDADLASRVAVTIALTIHQIRCAEQAVTI